tara:strand:- start:457 stop:2436 length:1980 start_codon:yes stop_codon:yes gene_type:complete
MFKRILIANRGEIACRIIKTARNLGIETVAVYSESDSSARHVLLADQAYLLGPSPASKSYLNTDRILQIAQDSNADAIHPGYGFLSENPRFAEMLTDNDIVFIGPSSKAIELMGDKIESKLIATKAGVNTIPGFTEALSGPDKAIEVAKQIGYPVMVKAAAGGGGKGMRLAASEAELLEGVQLAINEAESSFGDGRVFIEKFIEQPRHIEIQILADKHGNFVYLGERECSIQRRHQKIIEESPSSFLDDDTRCMMGEQACALARAVDYTSAGTVEFVVNQKKEFFFLEMNTRLQVEHPVTEFVTGLDLVEQQILIANDQPLEFNQSDIRVNGWAIESRVYAEDPNRGFVPSIGRLIRHEPPASNDKVRLDTGVDEGSEISMFYDPMISKLITFGQNRDEAINNMLEALDNYLISGISHNIGLLSAIINHPRFRAGNLTTAFMDEEFPDGFSGLENIENNLPIILTLAGAISFIISNQSEILKNIFDEEKNLVVSIDHKFYPITVIRRDFENFEVRQIESNLTIKIETTWQPHQRLLNATVNNTNITVQVWRKNSRFRLCWRGVSVPIVVRTARAAELMQRMPEKQPPDLSKYLLSPMPGLIVSIPVSEGEEVKAGQAIAIIDAMKMENILKSEIDSKIKKIYFKEGDNVAVDEVIIEFF